MGPLLLHLLLSTAAAAPLAGAVEEVWVRANTHADRAILMELPLGFAEGEEDGWLLMHAESAGMDALRRSGLEWRSAERALLPPAAYHSPEELVEALETLASSHPDRVTIVDLGFSHEERQVVGVRISGTATPQAQWRIAGAHHGDETSSAEVTLAAATELATTTDPVLEALLETDAIWLIPHINPDGVARLTRYNANSVDLNRNYDYEWSPTEFRPGDHGFSEPETRNLRALSAWVPFGAGISVHSGATNLGWVWNYTTEPSPVADLVEAIAETYEEGCDQSGFYITNGAEWYITHGDTTDWAYGRYGTLDYTLEVSNQKNPGVSLMSTVVAAHTPPVIDFLLWPWQIRGQAVDSSTGRGIPAVVTITGEEWPTQTGPEGHFARPTEDGVVTVDISAPGHQTQTISMDPSTPEAILVELTPTHVVEVRPSPLVLPRSGDGRFTLDVDSTALTLTRPGEPDVPATWDDDSWAVQLDSLAPGPWNLVTDSGVAPRSIFVEEIDELVVVDHVALADETRWVVTGDGFGRGTLAWLIFGPDRALIPLSVEAEAPDRLQLQHSLIAEADGPVEIVILSNGRQVVYTHVAAEATEDTGSPDEDTGSSEPPDSAAPLDTAAQFDSGEPVFVDDESPGKLTTCACATGGAYPGAWLLVSLWTLISRRRQP